MKLTIRGPATAAIQPRRAALRRAGAGPLVGPHLGVGDPAVVVDGDMDAIPAQATPAGGPSLDQADAPNVNNVTGCYS